LLTVQNSHLLRLGLELRFKELFKLILRRIVDSTHFYKKLKANMTVVTDRNLRLGENIDIEAVGDIGIEEGYFPFKRSKRIEHRSLDSVSLLFA
jgi:hypothetical protein